MGQLLPFRATEDAYDRLTEQQRLANIKEEQADAVRIARAVLRDPERYTPDNVRDACLALRKWGDGFDRLTASDGISRLLVREQIARNRAKQTPLQVAREHRASWRAIIAYGAVGAAILLAFTGWL